MNRFDHLAKSTAHALSRRRAARTLAAGAVGAMLARLSRVERAAGCRKVGRPCERDNSCCQGVCRSGRCRCPNGTARCGGVCCAPGQRCLPNILGSGEKICLNGLKQPGDDCDQLLPAECSSGVCGCFEGNCVCREATCQALDGDCGALEECCHGYCNFGSFRCDV
jgi:hypothetical protein